MSATTTISCAGEALVLDADRAAFWPRRATLVVGDVHLGKESVFGRHGLAVPGGVTDDDLARLARLVAAHRAERLVVLGDLVHAAPSDGARWPELVTRWLDDHTALDVVVVAGNHDRPAVREALDPRLTWSAAPVAETPFVFTHEPGPHPDGYALGGHLHPVVKLGGKRGDRLRCPAFWFRADHAVFPAFGAFTGGLAVEPAAGERVVVVGDGDLLELPGSAEGAPPV